MSPRTSHTRWPREWPSIYKHLNAWCSCLASPSTCSGTKRRNGELSSSPLSSQSRCGLGTQSTSTMRFHASRALPSMCTYGVACKYQHMTCGKKLRWWACLRVKLEHELMPTITPFLHVALTYVYFPSSHLHRTLSLKLWMLSAASFVYVVLDLKLRHFINNFTLNYFSIWMTSLCMMLP